MTNRKVYLDAEWTVRTMTEIVHRFLYSSTRNYEWCYFLGGRGLQVDIERSTILLYLWAQYLDYFFIILVRTDHIRPVPTTLKHHLKALLYSVEPGFFHKVSPGEGSSIVSEIRATNQPIIAQSTFDICRLTTFPDFLRGKGFKWITCRQADVLWEAAAYYQNHLCKPSGATPFRIDPRLLPSEKEILPLQNSFLIADGFNQPLPYPVSLEEYCTELSRNTVLNPSC